MSKEPKAITEELTEDQLEAVSGGTGPYLNRTRQKELLTLNASQSGKQLDADGITFPSTDGSSKEAS